MGNKVCYHKYIIGLLLVKFLYVYLNVLMLPDDWISFNFDRDIHLENVLIEIVSLAIAMGVYLKYLRPGHPLSFVATVFFCMYLIPANSSMSLSNYDFLYFASINLFNILFVYFLGRIANSSEIANIELLYGSQTDFANQRLNKTLRYLSLFTCLGVIAYVYFLRGTISLEGIFNDDLYDRRAIVADLYLQNTDGAIAYLMTIWGAFYASMLLVGLYLALKNRYIYDIVLFVFTYLVLFSFLTEKSILFKPIIALFVYLLFRTQKLIKAEYLFLAGYIGLCVVSLLEYYIGKESVVFSVVLRRMTYMPQYLSHAYYEYFSMHDKMWLTRDFFQLEKIVRLVIPSSYQHGAVTIISENCFPGVPSPNTGLFAEAFVQLGYLGVFVFSWLFAYVFKVYYKASLLFGTGAPHVLLCGLFLSLINIQMLAPRGILVVLIFLLICYWVKKRANINTAK